MAKRYALNKNKFLLDPELWRLEKLLKRSHASDPRNAVLLQLALATGARAQELLNLERADFNIYDEAVLIRGIKGSNDREIPLKKELFQRVLPLLEGLSDHHRVFPISYQRLRQIWQWYRPVPKKFHCLRHTFAIRLYQKTKDIRLVQFALGHRNITNTMIYADYVYSQQELKRLIL